MSNHRRAFTAIEILIVVVILAIVATVVMPALGSRGDLHVSAGARTLMSDLIYAQNLAVTRQTACYVKISATGYSLWTRPGGVATAVEHPIRRDGYAASFGAANTPFATVSLSSYSVGSLTDLAFDETGAPAAANTATGAMTPLIARAKFVLVSGTSSVTVYVEPYTGQLSTE